MHADYIKDAAGPIQLSRPADGQLKLQYSMPRRAKAQDLPIHTRVQALG
ncbi:hypothetical protein [Pseudoxanthomonas composti]|nr:hypothetical protein [Pseudoxanthomonas composti]